MSTKLLPTDSFSLGKIALAASPIYNRLTEGDRRNYIESALTYGKQAANSALASDQTIIELINCTANLTLKLKDAKLTAGKTVLRGETDFAKKQCVITVYKASVRSLFEDYRMYLPPAFRLTEKQALATHIAHEYFHYLEFCSGQTVAERLPKAEISLLHFWHQKIEVTVCSEIAAHAFAKQYCHLAVLPNYYDQHYLACQANEIITRPRGGL